MYVEVARAALLRRGLLGGRLLRGGLGLGVSLRGSLGSGLLARGLGGGGLTLGSGLLGNLLVLNRLGLAKDSLIRYSNVVTEYSIIQFRLIASSALYEALA